MASLPILGWREWVSLPDLGINRIKCKVDTGARTSALHAFHLEADSLQNRVMFKIHPLQNSFDPELSCVADILDRRTVTDSGGHKELRYVIATTITIGKHSWPIEMTLTDRDNMKFRMLLGRTALKKRFYVDSSSSYLMSK
jgi:hypothetical protein